MLIPSFYHVILLGKKQGPGGPKSTTKMRLLDGFPGITKGLGPSELGLGPQAPWRTAVFSADFVLGTQQGPNEKGNGGKHYSLVMSTVRYWKWPSRNSGFSHWIWRFSTSVDHAGSPSRRAKDAKALERSQVYHLPPCLRSGVIVFDALEVVVQLPTRGVMKTDGDNAILLEEFFQRYVPSTNFPFFCWFQKSWNILGMFSV